MAIKLTGITHAIVTTSTEEVAKTSRVLALIDLCFGPGDIDALQGIPYIKVGPRKFAFQGPRSNMYKNGEPIQVFGGSLEREVCTFASHAWDKVQALGKFQYGKRYRVTAKGAVEDYTVQE